MSVTWEVSWWYTEQDRKFYAGGWGFLVQLCANPLHGQWETHLNESQTHRPSFVTHFLCISKTRSTLPVQTAPAPLLFSIPLAHHQDKTVWQSQKLFLLCFHSQLEQRPGWHVTDSILGNGPHNIGDCRGFPNLQYWCLQRNPNFIFLCRCHIQASLCNIYTRGSLIHLFGWGQFPD